MNKRGNAFIGVALAIFLFVMGILFIPFLTDDITTARGLLDCSNASGITSGTKLLCLNIDLLVPYFILFIVSVALGYIVGGSK
jgi:hypothetical protein